MASENKQNNMTRTGGAVQWSFSSAGALPWKALHFGAFSSGKAVDGAYSNFAASFQLSSGSTKGGATIQGALSTATTTPLTIGSLTTAHAAAGTVVGMVTTGPVILVRPNVTSVSSSGTNRIFMSFE